MGSRKGRWADMCGARGREKMNSGESEAKLENKNMKDKNMDVKGEEWKVCMEVMLDGRSNEIILHENIFCFPEERICIVPAIQHGCQTLHRTCG